MADRRITWMEVFPPKEENGVTPVSVEGEDGHVLHILRHWVWMSGCHYNKMPDERPYDYEGDITLVLDGDADARLYIWSCYARVGSGVDDYEDVRGTADSLESAKRSAGLFLHARMRKFDGDSGRSE